MEKSDDLRLMVKIAQMYYEQDFTQAEIARALGIYRTSISRMLKKVREQGIVTISINYNYNENLLLEQQLKSRFKLREAIVVSSEEDQSPEHQLILMAKHCCALLNRIIENGDILGFSWGSAIATLVEQMETSPVSRQLTCIPMVGGPSGKLESRYHVNTLVYSAAMKLKGESLLIDFPAILEKSVIRDGIVQSQHYRAIADYWQRLDIAIFGIGSPNISGNSTWGAFYGSDVIDHFNDRQVAGDICSRFYDLQGNPVETYISDKTITIELEKIKKARYSIGIAHSHEKISGIIGAIKGKYINSLVTTKETAEEILKLTA
ncbi:sugar-binding transcriptional regulator [Yersinia mollaretii]|uniref:Transcriptional regulatory protein n=1 Tax=Yersinia mollaretii TaxID=33060 RepID=A0AA36LK66_YERMO|nr:sugar-binding transcriptional regulator [Yersinia mollaretii]MDA5525537.1 sugar-binding transcriptional regulator [Yersinia mollaretii]MDA5535324.1 sugar-binding transcriptional regulator [Yersinia mollaretii]MDR7872931.1 sugar-binding transcriptional regulator [Yersinia mollaretii]NIL03380.1 sugar-binding transcriptional regulator [Yersinia mollaretii]PHZ33630.1 Cro/Cl family transcriptional regulator [Yersinia mollaretii]